MTHRYNFEIGKISEMLYQLKSNLLTPDFDRATQREILEDTHRLWLENNRLLQLISELKEDGERLESHTYHKNSCVSRDYKTNGQCDCGYRTALDLHATLIEKVKGIL